MNAIAEIDSDPAKSSARKHRILVVDDDSSVREMLSRVLEVEGYEAYSASRGDEALTIVQSAGVDMVLLDLQLPGEDGWQAFRRLVALNPTLSVIIITAGPGQLFSALASGAGALLEKPLDFPKLLQTIRDLLAEPKERRVARIEGRRAEFHYLPAQSGGMRKLCRQYWTWNGERRL